MSDGETEITLGAGRLLSLFFGLVIMCAVFFVLGYRLGKNTPAPAPAPAVAEQYPVSGSKPSAPQAVVKPDCAKTREGCPPPAEADFAPATSPAEAPGGHSAAAVAHPNPVGTPEPKAPISTGYVVQVAAVSKQQDAEALLGALRKKQYPVFIATPPSDSLFHVQVGPFSDQRDAEAARGRLVADGYNPILKK